MKLPWVLMCSDRSTLCVPLSILLFENDTGDYHECRTSQVAANMIDLSMRQNDRVALSCCALDLNEPLVRRISSIAETPFFD